ncbi:MAG TPA: OsmC family protein [Candidatus Limnocylindrales bacterium]
MSRADIAAKIAAAREYLREHRHEARYRDSAATAVIEEGLRVRATGPDGASVVTDMTTGVGGGGSAPSPGWLFRAADASCIATLIAMRAAEEGIDLDHLEVTVDSESDDYGILGLDEAVPAGPLNMRVAVRVAAAGVQADRLRDLVDWGVAHCPVCDAAKRAVPVEVRIEVGAA